MNERRPLIRIISSAIAALAGFAFVVLPAYAQVDLGLNYGTSIGLGTQDVRTTVGTIINAFFGLLGVVAVVLILYAGFLWMTAGGNEEKVSTAKTLMRNAVIGLVILLSAFAIAQFILRAIAGGTGTNIGGGGGGAGGCPAGQNCGFGAAGGGGGGFAVSGISPVGTGSGNGWPKNFGITIGFTSAVEPSTVTESSIRVTRCNARVNGSGDPQPFDESACGAVVTGTRAVDGSKVVFKPDASAEDDPTDFEGDFWYKVRVQGLDIKDLGGRPLFCPPTPPGADGDVSSSSARRDLCDRAMAFNDSRDVSPPTVRLTAPSSPPSSCSAYVPVVASATDDFLVSRIDYLVNGSTVGLVDADGNPLASDVNAELSSPFVSSSVFIDTSALAPGETYTVTATAYDGVPQSSETSEREFVPAAPSCCNGVADPDTGETGIDCGAASACGACSGQSCTNDAECASGFCDPTTARCTVVPAIEGITPISAGPGSLVTITGRFFGSNEGSVVFLGADTDGDGNPEGDADDVTAQACAPAAWSDDEVVVTVPAGAVTGPILLRAANGTTDRSDDDRGPLVGAFTVGTETRPGICYVTPDHGGPGTSFTAYGNGFGDTKGDSTLTMGGVGADIATGGWSAAQVAAIVPPSIDEGVQPVRIFVGGDGGTPTNAVNFTYRVTAASTPHIVSIEPGQGPRGSYVTIHGTGFGSSKGVVRFFARSTDDVAIAGDPVCDDSWKDTSIVVKVPLRYASDLALLLETHDVAVETASPARLSNRVPFDVVAGTPGPGICAIEPDNGPAGTNVTVTGEGFGSGPGASPSDVVRFSADASGTTPLDADVYGDWTSGSVTAAVPGDLTDRDTWPVTGPVSVVAGGKASVNSVPFSVQDCNEGAACGAGTVCCPSGACQESCVPKARESAYGWNFSTDILPAVPQVVLRASCDADVGFVQSPTPYMGSSDACKNAEIAVEFTQPIDPISVDDPLTAVFESITVDECGTGDFDQLSCQSVPLGPPTVIDSGNGGSIVRVSPTTAYPTSGPDANTGYLRPNTWYRVTLLSDPDTEQGIRDVEGRYLDGDRDRKQGGSFTYRFKTRDDDSPCEVSAVSVMPSSATIGHEGLPSTDFDAALQAANCNVLDCNPQGGAARNYAIDWSSTPFSKLAIDTLQRNGCRAPVLGAEETVAGSPARLTASVTPVGQSLSKEGDAKVTVKFVDPYVASATPTASCTEACINASIGARFNVAMDPATLTAPGNVELMRCRNASCNEPMAVDLGGAVRTLKLVYDPEDLSADPAVIGFDFVGDGSLLAPATFYQVRIRAGADGVMSRSGTGLTRLNAEDAFTWKFRTKDDTTACSVSRVDIQPPRTLLHYVGERAGLQLSAFGPVDECADAGQQLQAGDYDWQWSIDPNPVVSGFMRAVPSSTGPAYDVDPVQTLDTNATTARGCTSSCTLRGSQIRTPQCGNGVRDKGEDCDTAIPADSARCTVQCLWDGKSPTCGNGTLEAGESCEIIDGKWIGCKDPNTDIPERPDLDGLGCVALGSDSTTGSVCGDGFISDGETCDDKNGGSGDGCSSQCVNEGTAPACSGATEEGRSCVSFCGNGIIEPGEDRECDLGVGKIAEGCNPATCTKIGTSPPLCGNGQVDPGEDPECETSVGVPEFCSSRCLLLGSSSSYSIPSFCGDGLVGYGEAPECEQAPDQLADPRQYVVAKNSDVNSSEGNVSIVAATTLGVPSGGEGKAEVGLSCTCKTLPTAKEQNAFCAEVGADAGLDLACANSGCCMQRPVVTMQEPNGRNDACRNSLISVTFDQEMDPVSVQQNMLVGFDAENDPCPDGSEEIAPLAVSGAEGFASAASGFWGRVWHAMTGAVRSVFGLPAHGNAPGAGIGDHSGHRYCTLKGQVVTYPIQGQEEGSVITRAEFRLEKAMPANTWIRVRVGPEARSRAGVSIGGDGYTGYFGTTANVCPIRKVTVSPESTLFTDLNGGDKYFAAQAHSADGQKIVPVADYAWEWQWTPQIDDGGPLTSPLILFPVLDAQDKETDIARGYVRGRETTDPPAGYEPKNGKTKVEVAAVILDPTDGSEVRRIANTSPTSDGGTPNDPSDDVLEGGGGDVTVMLCKNPWPAPIKCDGSALRLPWENDQDPAGWTPHECPANSSIWFPFFDRATNTEFSYCRDGQGNDGSAPQLPALKEVPVRVFPGGDILREYLFTYDQTAGPQDSAAEWSRDAIGLRIVKNPQHLGPSTWYASQGFRGNAVASRVDGYQALRDGRTTYVGAAAVTPTGDIYTNINVISHNNDASTETSAVYNQILSTIDFNRQPELADTLVCKVNGNTVIVDGAVLSCTTDLECAIDGKRGICDGDGVTACGSLDDCATAGVGGPCVEMTCHAPKSALVRDVKRFGDMQAMRTALLAHRPYPSLSAGSFMRGRTYSAWTSWGQALSSIGAPVDPVNRFDSCPPGYDGANCWNSTDRLFVCPTDSYVYRYRSLGDNAEISADLEYRDEQGQARWKGGSCLDLTTSGACNAAEGCVWAGTYCTYQDVHVLMGGLYGVDAMCRDGVEGQSGFCGDGVVNENDNGPDEVCEIGQLRATSCTLNGREGTKTQQCRSDCLGWEDAPGASCIAGYCGDGVVQGPVELCDDGVLNGSYGNCNATCTGYGFSCGDNQVYPSEACDCGVTNGSYAFNGVVAQPGETCRNGANQSSYAPAPSCSWDCSGAAPHCGDGIVNGTEKCDTETQVSKGYCNVSFDPCTGPGDCAAGAGSCILAPTVEQNYRRTCNANDTSTTADDATACTWAAWTLTSPGACGNGITETGEECDDGNRENNDGCTNQCKFNVCGDGYVNGAAGELCDDGPANGTPCIPDYNDSCRYCQSNCTVGQVSGGFCGDGFEQTPTSTPAGPEQCDAPDQALGGNWICVSTAAENESFGEYAGVGVCSAGSCRYGCISPTARPCLNEPGPNSDGAEDCSDTLGIDADGNDSGLRDFCLKNRAELPGSSQRIYDVCDPDDDNDGVPDAVDCRPKDPDVHPRYVVPDANIVIPPHPEWCGDGKDNDCDGQVDNLVSVSGRLLDVQTGGALQNATIQVYCGAKIVAETADFDENGYYSINEFANTSGCSTASQWSVRVGYPGDLCGATEKTFTYSHPACMTADNVDFEVSERPLAYTAQVRATVRWTHNLDLDLHMFSSKGDHVWYGNPRESDDGYVYELSGNDTGSNSGSYNPGGIETITVNRRPGVEYQFAVFNNDVASQDWWKAISDAGYPIADQDTEDNDVTFRVYYDDCTEYRPEQFGEGLSKAWLDQPGKPWFAYVRATDGSLTTDKNADNNRYTFGCFNGTTPGPCAYVCDSLHKDISNLDSTQGDGSAWADDNWGKLRCIDDEACSSDSDCGDSSLQCVKGSCRLR